ncbi:hypothetical protein [Spirosoma sp.]|uniref:hypothetical protein n=1 Tax=Spirosoma sp. TaxID=1899569 RepID=UPI00261E9A7E|nr:hypothetical protein [Spirosoma sp.]MCX6216565.1 hypothetical protein [Spirosoma sp.]
MQLEIRMNGEPMELAPNSRADLELVSPYLTYEDILSSKATIPNLPATPRNRSVLGYPDLLQNDSRAFRYNCEKYYNGQLLQSGIGVLTEAGTDYSFTVVQALGEFFGDYQNKPLTDIDFGSIPLPALLTPIVNEGSSSAVCFPTIVNPDFYSTSGGAIGYGGKMNDYYAGAYTSGGPLVPMVYVDYLFKRIASLTGTTIEGAYFDKPELRKLILFNTRALDGASAVTLSRHLPELTLAQFLLELRKFFNLSFTINGAEKRLTIGFTKDILSRAAVLDWSDKAVKKFKKIPETARRMQLGSETEQADALVKDRPLELEDYLTPELGEPTGIAPLKSKFSSLVMDAPSGTAACKQPGITEQFGQLTNKFSPRLLFYLSGEGLNSIPKASSELGDVSLYWTGVKGLAAVFWRVNEKLRNEWFYVTRDMNLSEFDLASFDFSKKVHVNGVNYLVVKITVSVPISKPAQVTFIRA